MQLHHNHTVLRVVTYNIASSSFAPDRGEEKMNGLLRDLGAELAGLQEVDFCNGRHNYDMLDKFLRCGDFPWGSFQKAIPYRGGAYGIGWLSRLQPLESSGGALPGTGNVEGRAYQRLLLEKDGKKIAFYNTHLCYEDPKIRHRQMCFLADLMQQDPAPYRILTGDLNTDQGPWEMEPLLEQFTSANGAAGIYYDTFNRPAPDMKCRSIDHIVFSSNICLLQAGMEENTLSDHNLFWADLELM